MKIGILYIATGRYICFWDEFYNSAQKYLFKDHEKTYFLITDAADPPYVDNKTVMKYYYPKLPWPQASMFKFGAFYGLREDLSQMNYLYHFNSNMIFVDDIGDEILPNGANDGLAACVWPYAWHNNNVDELPYDRNPLCWANIDPGEGKRYFMGGVHGGRTREYLQMCAILDEKMKEDFEKGIIAVNNDESYVNKYLLDKNPLIMTPNYAMPAKRKIKGFENNIKGIITKKHHYRYGGHAYLRGETDKKITPLKYHLNKLFNLNLK